MNQYRFHLKKYDTSRRNNKLTCPECGKSNCFVKYVDEEGVIVFPDYVGRCDHENACGYHYTPKDYFHDNPDAKSDAKDNDGIIDKPHISRNPENVKTEPVAPSFISEELMRKSLSHYEINPLHRYLYKTIGSNATNHQFERYCVGTSNKWNGSTVFWQIDVNNNIRGGKVMAYNPQNGHRIKEPQAYVSWVHSLLKLPNYNLKQCLFGEHLLNSHPTTPIMLVEREKTCLIASHFMPDFLWLATGGKNGCFNEDALQVLRGRDVILMPDLGATEKWQVKSDMLKPFCHSVMLSDVLEKTATDEQRMAGLDIADFLLMQETKQMLLARMIELNPALQKLIDALELEIVEDDS